MDQKIIGEEREKVEIEKWKNKKRKKQNKLNESRKQNNNKYITIGVRLYAMTLEWMKLRAKIDGYNFFYVYI